MSRRAEVLLLLAILAVAAWLRLAGIEWGLPHPYHPDEGSILFHALGFGTGDLNPHWFRWPSLFMYKMFGVYGAYYVVGRFAGTFSGPADLVRQYLTDLTPFWLMGRVVSAAAGVATVWVSYATGKRAFSRFAGLAAAGIMAVVYLHVRDSHYATPDVFTTLLASVSLLLAVSAVRSGRVRTLVLSGLFAGLAASAKYPGILAGAGTFAAWGMLVRRRLVSPAAIVPAALAAVVGFVAGTPFSVLSFAEFRRDIVMQFTMVSSAGPAAASSFTDGLKELFFGTLGRGVGWLVLALAVVGSFAPPRFWTVLEPRRGGRELVAGASGGRAVVMTYAAAFLAVMCVLTVKRSTYMTPALPAVAVLAAAGIEALFVPLRGRTRAAVAGAAALLVAVVTALPSVAFDRALACPDTRTVAERWVEENVPPGTRIALETYGPVLNPTVEQLVAAVHGSRTAVGTWEGPKRRLAEMRLDVGRARSPQYEVYGIGWGEPAFRLPDPWTDPEALERELTRLGVTYVIITSKAQQSRPMDGAAPPPDETPWEFSKWLEEHGTRVVRFTAACEVPVIDRGPGRSFHSPVIEVYRLEPVRRAEGAER